MKRLFGSDKLPPGVRRAFRLPWSRPAMRRDLDDELRFHLEMRVAELRAHGVSERDAEAEAMRRLGDEAELKAYCLRLDERRALVDRAIAWAQGLGQDVHIAARHARRNPAFTALAVLTLALGIGANSAIFTVVHRLLLAPFPYPDGNRIVALMVEGKNGAMATPSGFVVHAWSERAHTIGPIAAIEVDDIAVQDVAEQDTIDAHITANYLDVLGLRPSIGRSFTRADEQPGAAPVAMITTGLWQRAYGGRASVIGSVIHVHGTPYTIVGVAPPAMGDPMSLRWAGARLHQATPSIYVPASLDSIAGGDAFARLRSGVSAAQASRELQAILQSTPRPPPRPGSMFAPPSCCARAVNARDLRDPREVQAVEVLFAAVGVLLLIACANVASLLMARAWTRRREFAVRVALGAGRARLARFVLTESVMTALAGGALGVLLAWQGLRVIVRLRPPTLADLDGARVDPAVLLWSLGISLVAGILFGSAPALFAGGRHVGDVLKSATSGASADQALRRVRSGLIVAEIAMALVLLSGAGLLVRSFVGLERTPVGFDPHQLVALDVITGLNVSRAERFARARAILDRLRATPGVVGAAVGNMPGDDWHLFGATLESDPDAAGQTRSVSRFGVTLMTPDYFRVARMPLLAGRAPREQAEQTGSATSPAALAEPREVVVDRAMARLFWPDGGAIGARLHARSPRPGAEGELFTIVGIVEGAHIPSTRAPSEPTLYEAIVIPANVAYLVRVAADPHAIAPLLRRVVSDAAPGAVARSTTIGGDFIRDALAPTRFAMALLAAFAIVAVTLAAVGLYGMIAYSVSQRTREIGVRVALGANPGAITRLVLGDGVRLAVIGAMLGVAGSIAATRALRGMLYQIAPSDPGTLCAVAALVIIIALLASYAPARRALRVDPTEALRAD